MIISHKYKIIFIKCGKVAGTSVEMALRPHLGEHDVITPVAAKDELFAQKNGIPASRNFKNSMHYDDRVRNGSSRGVFYEHAWAYEIKGLISPEVWSTYFKFAIERDPREKSLSTYYHNRNGIRWPKHRNALNTVQSLLPLSMPLPLAHPSIAKFVSLERWLQEDRLHTFCDNWCRYTVNDELIIDRVYAFSELNTLVEDLENIIDSDIKLPRLKADFREDRNLTSLELDLLDKLLDNHTYQKEFKLISKKSM